MNMGVKLALALTFFLISGGNCLKCFTCKNLGPKPCDNKEQGELTDCEGESYCEISYNYGYEDNMLLNNTGHDFPKFSLSCQNCS